MFKQPDPLKQQPAPRRSTRANANPKSDAADSALASAEIPAGYESTGGLHQGKLTFQGKTIEFGSENATFESRFVLNLCKMTHSTGDGPNLTLPYFLGAADLIHEKLTKFDSIAVHCAHGSSRTSFALAAYFSEHQNMPFASAVKYIQNAQDARTKAGEIQKDRLFTFEPRPKNKGINIGYYEHLDDYFSSNPRPEVRRHVVVQTLSDSKNVILTLGGSAKRRVEQAQHVAQWMQEVRTVPDATADELAEDIALDASVVIQKSEATPGHSGAIRRIQPARTGKHQPVPKTPSPKQVRRAQVQKNKRVPAWKKVVAEGEYFARGIPDVRNSRKRRFEEV